MGVPFDVVPPKIGEEVRSGLAPERVAEELAERKARAVAGRFPDRIVLGADTIVVVGDRILGKPSGRGEAEGMLRTLSGSKHRVITGLCLLLPGGGVRLAHEASRVTMRPIGPEEIRAYLDAGEWEGKAGAYAIQESADRFVVGLEGSFDNVVGLPTELLGKLLAGLGPPG